MQNCTQNGDARRLNFDILAQHLGAVASWHPYATAPAHPPAGKRECVPGGHGPVESTTPTPAAAAGWGWELKGHRRPRPRTPLLLAPHPHRHHPPTHTPPPLTPLTQGVAGLWWLTHSGRGVRLGVCGRGGGWVQRTVAQGGGAGACRVGGWKARPPTHPTHHPHPKDGVAHGCGGGWGGRGQVDVAFGWGVGAGWCSGRARRCRMCRGVQCRWKARHHPTSPITPILNEVWHTSVVGGGVGEARWVGGGGGVGARPRTAAHAGAGCAGAFRVGGKHAITPPHPPSPS